MICKRCGINETRNYARPRDACHKIIANEQYDHHLLAGSHRQREYAPKLKLRKRKMAQRGG